MHPDDALQIAVVVIVEIPVDRSVSRCLGTLAARRILKARQGTKAYSNGARSAVRRVCPTRNEDNWALTLQSAIAPQISRSESERPALVLRIMHFHKPTTSNNDRDAFPIALMVGTRQVDSTASGCGENR
jgi:hypothetical protein